MIIELLPPNTGQAFDAMRALRTSLVDRDDFVRQVDQRQRPSGYRLIASLPDQGDSAVAVAGFRLGENLAWGRHLYIDDLSTLPAARKQGHARLLLDGCTTKPDASSASRSTSTLASESTGPPHTVSTSTPASGSALTTSPWRSRSSAIAGGVQRLRDHRHMSSVWSPRRQTLLTASSAVATEPDAGSVRTRPFKTRALVADSRGHAGREASSHAERSDVSQGVRGDRQALLLRVISAR